MIKSGSRETCTRASGNRFRHRPGTGNGLCNHQLSDYFIALAWPVLTGAGTSSCIVNFEAISDDFEKLFTSFESYLLGKSFLVNFKSFVVNFSSYYPVDLKQPKFAQMT